MEEMADGLDIDQNTLIAVLQNKLAQATIREAQLETAVQMLMQQNRELTYQVTQTNEPEAEDASANDG